MVPVTSSLSAETTGGNRTGTLFILKQKMVLHGSLGIFAILVVCVSANSPEVRLVRKLLSDYEHMRTVVRPVFNSSETVRVSYGLALINIQDFDEISQVLTITAWSRYSWSDNFLKWDPTSYGGIDHTRLPPAGIWQPDIVLFNQFDPAKSTGPDNSLTVVSHSGNVLWIPPRTYQVFCFKGANGTYDCPFKFGSWTYDGFKVDIDFYTNLEEIDVTDYIEHPEWNILSHSASKNVKTYPCCEEPYPNLVFNMTISKK